MSRFEIAGRAALVTGGASGIGFALAAALAARGARLMLADVDGPRLASAAQTLGAQVIEIDLAAPEAPAALIAAAMERLGAIDLVCSNAGIGRNKRLKNETFDAATDRLFAVNLFAGLRLAQAYRAALPQGAHGRMLFTASENSLGVPAAVRGAGLGLYAASKHGLLVALEWLRDEWAGGAIDLHVLLPGAVWTPLIDKAIPDPAAAPPELGLITPARCAEIALKGLELGLFYIPTHAHLARDMRPRTEAVAAALEALGLA